MLASVFCMNLLDQGRYLFFCLVKIGSVKEFCQRDSGALAKPFDGDHLGALGSSLHQVIDGRGRHSSLERGIANIDLLLLADLKDPLDNCVVQLHNPVLFALFEPFCRDSTIIIGQLIKFLSWSSTILTKSGKNDIIKYRSSTIFWRSYDHYVFGASDDS